MILCKQQHLDGYKHFDKYDQRVSKQYNFFRNGLFEQIYLFRFQYNQNQLEVNLQLQQLIQKWMTNYSSITLNLLPMQLNQNLQHSVNLVARASPYVVVTFEGKNYRILGKQHFRSLQMTQMWCVFWYSVSFALFGSSVITFLELKTAFILLFAIISHTIFTIYIYIKKKIFKGSLLYSSINLLVFMIPITIFAFLEIKQILIPLAYYIIIETILSIKLMNNKSQIVAKLIVLIEAMMIGFKVDQKIQSPWKDILFSHIIFFLFLILCLLFMTVYLVYMIYGHNQQNLMKQKFAGALFIYFNTIGFCFLSALPLFNIFFQISIWIICLVLAFVFTTQGTCIYFYQKQIVIFFCTLNEIKSFNQMISFQPIRGIKQEKMDIFSNDNDKISQKMYMYRISQNWLTFNPQKATQSQQSNQQPLNQLQSHDIKITNCIICWESHAEVVWMPCGHLSVCLQCCSFMFRNRNLNCVLCKKAPQQIYIIDVQDKQCCEIGQKYKNPQTYTPNDDASVISEGVIQNQTNLLGKKQLLPNKQVEQINNNNEQQLNRTAFLVLQGYHVKII